MICRRTRRGVRCATALALGLMLAATSGSQALAAEAEACWDSIWKKGQEAREKRRQGDLEAAEQAALTAYAWSHRGANSRIVGATGVLLAVLETRGSELAAAGVACALEDVPTATDPALVAFQKKALERCAEDTRRIGSKIELDVAPVEACVDSPVWRLELTVDGKPLSAKTFAELPRFGKRVEIVLHLRVMAPQTATTTHAAPATAQPPAPVANAARAAVLPDPSRASSPAPPPQDEGSTWFCGGSRLYPCSVGLAGLLAMGGAGITGSLASSREDSADRVCTARDACQSDQDARAANQKLDDARDLAKVSDALWLGGAVLTVGGVVWYLLVNDAPPSGVEPPPVAVSCMAEGCQLWGRGHF